MIEAGLMAGALMSGEKASAEPYRAAQAETEVLGPDAGFQKLLDNRARLTGEAKGSLTAAKTIMENARRNADADKNDPNNTPDIIQGVEGAAEARATIYAMLLMVSQELELQKAYQKDKSDAVLKQLMDKARELRTRFFKEKILEQAPSAITLTEREKKERARQADPKKARYLRDLTGFLNEVKAYVNSERGFYGTSLPGIDMIEESQTPLIIR